MSSEYSATAITPESQTSRSFGTNSPARSAGSTSFMCRPMNCSGASSSVDMSRAW